MAYMPGSGQSVHDDEPHRPAGRETDPQRRRALFRERKRALRVLAEIDRMIEEVRCLKRRAGRVDASKVADLVALWSVLVSPKNQR